MTVKTGCDLQEDNDIIRILNMKTKMTYPPSYHQPILLDVQLLLLAQKEQASKTLSPRPTTLK